VKTISLKKVSAVAVASLGFGLLSVVPAQAAQAATGFTALNVKAATANTNVTSTSIKLYVGGTLAAAATDWVTTSAATQFYRAAVTTYPTNGYIVPTGVAEVANAEFLSAASAAVITNTISGNKIISTKSNAAAFSGAAAETVTATGTTGLASYTFTPTVAGSYSITTWNDVSDDGVIDPTEARVTTTVVVTAAVGLSPTLSTAYMAAAETAAAGTTIASTSYTSTTTKVQRAGYKTSGTAIAEVEVMLINTDGTAAGAGHTVSCQVTGAGFCEVGDTVGEEATTAVTLRSDSLALAGNQGYVTIVADGTAGTGSVEIKVTDAVTEAVTSLATRTYYVFGDVTTLTVTQILKIGKSGGGNVGYSGATRSATNIAATVVKATDSLGQAANITASGVPTLVPTDVTVSSGGTCVKDDGSVPLTYSPGLGFGFYNCDLATPSSAVSGKSTATIARIVSPADATLYIKSAEFTTSVGGSISSAKETLSFDKTSYAPGEAMIITRTAVDSSGNPVWDGSASPAVTFSKATGGSGGGAGAYVAGKSATSTTLAGATVFAPVSPGAFTGIMTGGATGAATNGITASATVTDANAGLLTQIDALNAKIVALNALIAKIMKKLGVK
jgi:hypothetical protein